MLDKKTINLIWFRQDLRLSDNPALFNACIDANILPIYILDDINAGQWKMGAASRCWLHHSLANLDQSLSAKLNLYKGNPLTIIKSLCQQFNIDNVYWNRCYEPWRIRRDKHIKTQLLSSGIHVHSYNASLLWEPWKVLKKDQTPYKVFTPFYQRGCLSATPPRPTLPFPTVINSVEDDNSLMLEQFQLLPTIKWDDEINRHWSIKQRASERGASQRLTEFLNHSIANYKEGRDLPAQSFTSNLAASLHFGELSPNQVYYAAQQTGLDQHCEDAVDCFQSELAWREFAYYLLYFFNELPEKNWKPQFDSFPWQHDPKALNAWQRGQTGIPMVDAGMRELWQTGTMHNRVRMITASFLVKNLMIDWRLGQQWFWDCLVDADLASNSSSWQWVSGSGCDAAPFFRIFNPVTQSQRFDKNGDYIRRYIPEIANLPNKYLFQPWTTPDVVLQQLNIELGKDYPMPIVDLTLSRQQALDAYKSIK